MMILHASGHNYALTSGDRRFTVLTGDQDTTPGMMLKHALDTQDGQVLATHITTPMQWADRDNMIDFHKAVDKAYQLNMRLCLFVGEVWANQIIASMQHHANTGQQSYMELMRQAVDTAMYLYSKGRT